jgi:Flp pilus assembly pilin Flp
MNGSKEVEMLTKMNRLMRRRRAQGMTEYIIIVALIAIGAIGVVTLFGNNIRALFSASVEAMTGKDDVRVDTKEFKGKLDKSLKTFGDNKSR